MVYIINYKIKQSNDTNNELIMSTFNDTQANMDGYKVYNLYGGYVEDDDETTPAKAEWAKTHFEAVNEKLQEPLPGNFDRQYKEDIKQFYTFDLLTPDDYEKWFNNLKSGKSQFDIECFVQ
jgi:hypothetical protein